MHGVYSDCVCPYRISDLLGEVEDRPIKCPCVPNDCSVFIQQLKSHILALNNRSEGGGKEREEQQGGREGERREGGEGEREGGSREGGRKVGRKGGRRQRGGKRGRRREEGERRERGRKRGRGEGRRKRRKRGGRRGEEKEGKEREEREGGRGGRRGEGRRKRRERGGRRDNKRSSWNNQDVYMYKHKIQVMDTPAVHTHILSYLLKGDSILEHPLTPSLQHYIVGIQTNTATTSDISPCKHQNRFTFLHTPTHPSLPSPTTPERVLP